MVVSEELREKINEGESSVIFVFWIYVNAGECQAGNFPSILVGTTKTLESLELL